MVARVIGSAFFRIRSPFHPELLGHQVRPGSALVTMTQVHPHF